MQDRVNIAIMGAAGRMGKMLIRSVMLHPKARLVGAIASSNSSILGMDSGLVAGMDQNHIPFRDDFIELLAHGLKQHDDQQGDNTHPVHVVIDFSTKENALNTASLCAQNNNALVLGVTGFDPAEQAQLSKITRHCPLVQAANFSIGVTLACVMAEKMARILDDDYDIEIVEMHHKHKLDAPSGTALALGKAAAKGRDIDHETRAIYERAGHIGARGRGDIGYAALRGGDVVGDHQIIFAGNGERVSLGHQASDRHIFSDGAVRAAIFAASAAKGHYSMRDVLGL